MISLWYLAMTTVLTIGQFYIERYFARGTSRGEPPPTLPQRLWRAIRYIRPQQHEHDNSPRGDDPGVIEVAT